MVAVERVVNGNEAFDGPERRTWSGGSGSRPGVLSAAIEGLVSTSLAVGKPPSEEQQSRMETCRRLRRTDT
jgi:hypothetical protein